MSIATSHPERVRWLAAAHRITLELDDLRTELSIAISTTAPTDHRTLIALAESDADIADGAAMIDLAAAKIGALP